MQKDKKKAIATEAKILIVDDHDEFRKTLRDYLRTVGESFEIYEATTGEESINQALYLKPEVILMDIRLPDISGIDAARQIKKTLPQTKIVMITMFESKAFRQVYECRDMEGYIGKNEMYEKLRPCLQGLLASKKNN